MLSILTPARLGTTVVHISFRGMLHSQLCRLRDRSDIPYLPVLQVAELQQGSVGQVQAELRRSQAAATDLAQRMINLQHQILTDAGGGY